MIRATIQSNNLRCSEPVRNITADNPAASKHWVEETYGRHAMAGREWCCSHRSYPSGQRSGKGQGSNILDLRTSSFAIAVEFWIVLISACFSHMFSLSSPTPYHPRGTASFLCSVGDSWVPGRHVRVTQLRGPVMKSLDLCRSETCKTCMSSMALL